MSSAVCLLLAALLCAHAAPAAAISTETAPQGVFVIDTDMIFSRITGHWHDDGSLGSLMDPVKLYEPGGGLQGTLIPDVEARYTILLTMLMYGVTDSLSAFVGVPLVLETTVSPDLLWEPGDYSPQIGREYSSDDFWEWAGSMGQPKPSYWEGNQYTLSDIVIGLRYRFSDRLEGLPEELGLSLTVFGALPTGVPPDPEEIVSAGTESWSLHSQGDIGLHVAADYHLANVLDGRLTLGADVFYQMFLPRTYESSTGEIHPLLLNHRPYVGESYRVNPGDFLGFEAGAHTVLVRGPVLDTWLTRMAPELADFAPPLLRLTLSYGFTGVAQSRWYSDSEIYNWEQESFWAPGYKNILTAGVTASLLRLGVPLDIEASVRNLTLLPGKNVRAPNIFFLGLRIPLKFW